MRDNDYYIFYHNENASWGVDGPFNAEEVSKRLAENHYGDLKIQKDPEDIDENSTGILVLKGEVIIPKPVKVVTQYQL
jgi:hypothetical protein